MPLGWKNGITKIKEKKPLIKIIEDEVANQELKQEENEDLAGEENNK